jgi:hypothetical protein
MRKRKGIHPLRLNPWLGKYVPAPVDAVLTDAEKEALEILLRRTRGKKERNLPLV